MKTIAFSRLFPAVIIVAASLAPWSASADWMINAGLSSTAMAPQDIVITLKLNPMSHPEAACLAVTMARMLRGDFSGGPGSTSVNVTLFPTLDGVAIGDFEVVRRSRFKCEMPDESVISLQENLENFLCDTGDRADCPDPSYLNMNNLVECPICWKARYGDELPYYGVLNPMAVGAVLMNAEKLIDF